MCVNDEIKQKYGIFNVIMRFSLLHFTKIQPQIIFSGFSCFMLPSTRENSMTKVLKMFNISGLIEEFSSLM